MALCCSAAKQEYSTKNINVPATFLEAKAETDFIYLFTVVCLLSLRLPLLLLYFLLVLLMSNRFWALLNISFWDYSTSSDIFF